MLRTPPVIETPRLRLRGHRYDDLSDSVAMWSDSVVTQYIGGKPSTRTQTWARLQAYVGHWNLLGYGYWLIETKDGAHFAGEVGLADFKRDIAASMKNDPEIGFALVPEFYGKGIATEAVRGVLAWADANLPFGRTVCLIDPQNHASCRVAEKCGYRLYEAGTYNDKPALFLERARPFASVELRRYRLKPGRRDELIALFENEFLESQEACGMVPFGHFHDLDDADAFVWLRGFPSFEDRAAALERFYVQSDAWRRHRETANDTMVDSDDVLLLRPARNGSGVTLTCLFRPAADADGPASRYLWIAEILLADPISEAAVGEFEAAALPRLREAARDIAYFVTDRRVNEFPKLPVRENEHAFVVYGLCRTLGDIETCREIVNGAFRGALPVIAIKHHRLVPGRRSLLR